jgi:hypothetical protein
LPKPKFVELKFADNNKYPRHSLTGYFVISESRNNGNVELFLRLPDADAGPPVAKKKKTSKRVSKPIDHMPSTPIAVEGDL